MQDLVPDLSICQEAQEKEIKIESKFWWVHEFCDEEIDDRWEIRDKKDESVICGIKCDGFESIPAPLTDEILRVLPKFLTPESEGGDECIIIISFWAGQWNVKYDYFQSLECSDKKLSNALLLLAIKLKKEGII